MQIGKTIKLLRKEKGWTQEDFSKKIDISVTSLSLIESGATRPNKTTLLSICNVLEIPESFLFVLSISEDDVPPEKREVYKILAPTLRNIVEQLVK